MWEFPCFYFELIQTTTSMERSTQVSSVKTFKITTINKANSKRKTKNSGRGDSKNPGERGKVKL